MRTHERRRGTLAIIVVCALASLLCRGTASAGDPVATLTNTVDSIAPQDIQMLHDSMEASLIRRLMAGDKLGKDAKAHIIEALGHIRSEKAVPYLLECLEFSPWKITTPDGHELSISRTTYEGTYPAIAALKKIGRLSSDRIVELISQSLEGSEREQILVALGSACDRKVFRSSVRDQVSKSGDKKARWERILSLLPPE